MLSSAAVGSDMMNVDGATPHSAGAALKITGLENRPSMYNNEAPYAEELVAKTKQNKTTTTPPRVVLQRAILQRPEVQ